MPGPPSEVTVSSHDIEMVEVQVSPRPVVVEEMQRREVKCLRSVVPFLVSLLLAVVTAIVLCYVLLVMPAMDGSEAPTPSELARVIALCEQLDRSAVRDPEIAGFKLATTSVVHYSVSADGAPSLAGIGMVTRVGAALA